MQQNTNVPGILHDVRGHVQPVGTRVHVEDEWPGLVSRKADASRRL